ncbi:MAG TPA: iron uptake porin [Coleofasciculaceae cyanobacterium]|jgi:BMFP domain-containing protein YqiC
MYKNFWNSLLGNSAILGAALVVSASASARETPAAKEEAQPQIVEAHVQEVGRDTSSVTTTAGGATIWATQREGLTVNDIESSVPMTVSDRIPAIADSTQPSTVSTVIPPDTPTAETPLSAPSLVAQMPSDTSNTSVLEQINDYSNESSSDPLDPFDQVTNVTQLTDVRPTDWAYEALRSLVERYGCIVGYPDRTYRGNQALSRYEFAAGLNACLNQIERLIASSTADFVRKQDLETLQRLVQEFRTELTALGARVDKLEGRVAFLEDHQFSTTTKLNAAVIFALTGVARGQNAFTEDIDSETAFGDRIRLNFDTSFTGKDLLRTRLQALNLSAFSANTTRTPEGDLRFAAGTYSTSDNNQVAIDALLYQFPIGEKTTVVIEANAGAPDDFTNTVNPRIDGDGDNGALSNFGTRNPIYNLVTGAGIGIRHEFSDAIELSLGYLASDAATPNSGAGLFNGAYGALAQLTIKPIDKLTLGLTYVHSYKNDLTAGSNRANLSSFVASITAPVPPTSSSPGSTQLVDRLGPVGGFTLPTSSNSYGLEAVFEFNPNFTLGGWVGYTTTRTLSSLGDTIGRGDLSIWNWAVTLAVSDLGKKGSVAGIIVGMEPKVTSVSDSLSSAIGEDPDTSLHIEGFYQFQLTENIAITPGVIWLTAPDHNANNDDIVIGVIRTTFTF